MTIIAAADGSALGNPGPAGWAWYVDDGCWDAGGWKHATNNQGELKAVLELFRATAHVNEDLLVLCDSQYVINSVTKWMPGWKRKGWRKADGSPVMNVELLKELDEALQGRDFTFEWVKGHVGHELNEAADVRARAVAEAYRRGTPVPSGPGFTAGHTISTEVRPEVSAPRPTIDPAAELAGPERVGASFEEEDDALFSLDAPTWHPFTISLTEDEHERLLRRARDRGVTPEELLRGLI
ncbi:ribonuclease HI [Salinibacterium sp. dk2585]|uniref:RNase H family protein n=1 Tax=unclassified Salinibacterium TaxID=2632331 RepID=UPI0011C24C0F|nr:MULTISPECIES: RNase H family protein [unclassified Salinibacterium]QEE62015.1 ribonuclease HI [Salinibacterium sp. dk2585]TXK54430.1 ribonuclease HI [Salinibacterium sp. dk5596]